jgi:alginate O-acetyltransferase complex protein AlgI
MFGNSSATEEIYSIAVYLTPDKMFFLGIGVLFSLFPVERMQRPAETLSARGKALLQAGALVCFVYSLSLIGANGFNPFIYFRF